MFLTEVSLILSARDHHFTLMDDNKVTPTMKKCLGNQTDRRVIDTPECGTSDTVHAGSCLCFVQPEVPT